jgi:Protein kinase domain
LSDFAICTHLSLFFFNYIISYVAPEVLKNVPYDQSSDMWSVGIILYLLLSGNPPFIDDNQSELFRKIRTADWKFKGEEWDDISYDAKNLIKRCLIANPIQRITAKEALQCKWLGGPGFSSEIENATTTGGVHRRVKSNTLTSPRQRQQQQQLKQKVVMTSPDTITLPVVDPVDNMGAVEDQMAVEQTINVPESSVETTTAIKQQQPSSVVVSSLTTTNTVPAVTTTKQQDNLTGKVEVNMNIPKTNNIDLVPVQLNATTDLAEEKQQQQQQQQKSSNEYSSTNKSYLPSEDPLRRDDIGIAVTNDDLTQQNVVDAPETITTPVDVTTIMGNTNPRASAQAQKFLSLMQGGTSKPVFVDNSNNIQQVDNAMVDYYYDGPNSPAVIDPQRKKYVVPVSNQQLASSVGGLSSTTTAVTQQQQQNGSANQSRYRRSDSNPNPRSGNTTSSPRHNTNNEGGNRSRDPDGVIAANNPITISSIRSPPLTSDQPKQSQQQSHNQNPITPKRRSQDSERRSRRRHSMNQAMERLEI